MQIRIDQTHIMFENDFIKTKNRYPLITSPTPDELFKALDLICISLGGLHKFNLYSISTDMSSLRHPPTHPSPSPQHSLRLQMKSFSLSA